jgi:predicted acetyltransferase
MVHIQNITPHEFDEAMTLGEFAFQIRIPLEERQARIGMMQPHQQWGAYVDDTLAAKYTLLDLETWIHGVKFPMGGLAGVATWPDYRRQGLVSKLLVHSLETMRDSEMTVSFLAPFSIPFYRKFGWELYTDNKQYELTIHQLPQPSSQPGRVRRAANDGAALQPIYDAYAKRYSGTLVRTEAWWRDRIFFNKKGTVAIYENASNEARGYVFYEVLERKLTVHELVTLDEEARLGLWGYLRNHDSMADRVVLKAPADDDLAFLLPDPRVKQELVPYFMARVVDAAAFVAAYPFVAGAAATLDLRVHDTHAPWNDGEFTLAVDPAGRGTLAPAASGAAVCGALSCSIGALSAMLMGYRRPAHLHAVGMLAGSADAVATLARLLPQRATYLPDFF